MTFESEQQSKKDYDNLVGIKNAECQVDIKTKNKDRYIQATEVTSNTECQVELIGRDYKTAESTCQIESSTSEFQCQADIEPVKELPKVVEIVKEVTAAPKELVDQDCQTTFEHADVEIFLIDSHNFRF